MSLVANSIKHLNTRIEQLQLLVEAIRKRVSEKDVPVPKGSCSTEELTKTMETFRTASANALKKERGVIEAVLTQKLERVLNETFSAKVTALEQRVKAQSAIIETHAKLITELRQHISTTDAIVVTLQEKIASTEVMLHSMSLTSVKDNPVYNSPPETNPLDTPPTSVVNALSPLSPLSPIPESPDQPESTPGDSTAGDPGATDELEPSPVLESVPAKRRSRKKVVASLTPDTATHVL